MTVERTTTVNGVVYTDKIDVPDGKVLVQILNGKYIFAEEKADEKLEPSLPKK
jgi:hypothetical protein